MRVASSRVTFSVAIVTSACFSMWKAMSHP